MQVALITALGLIIATFISKYDLFLRSQSKILKDVELYKSLPEESTSRAQLLANIDTRITELITYTSVKKRDPTSIILGLIFILLGVYFARYFHDKGSWWLIGLFPALASIILGIAGLSTGLKKTYRVQRRSTDHENPFL